MDEEKEIISEAESIVEKSEDAPQEITDKDIHGASESQEQDKDAAEDSEKEKETEDDGETEDSEDSEDEAKESEDEEFVDEVAFLKEHGLDEKFKSLDDLAKAVKEKPAESSDMTRDDVAQMIERITGKPKEAEVKKPQFFSVADTLKSAATKNGVEVEPAMGQLANLVDMVQSENNKVLLGLMRGYEDDMSQLISNSKKNESHQMGNLFEVASKMLDGKISNKADLDNILKEHPTLLKDDNPYFAAHLQTMKNPEQLKKFMDKLAAGETIKRIKGKRKIKTLGVSGKSPKGEPVGDLNKYFDGKTGRGTEKFNKLSKKQQDEILIKIGKEDGVDFTGML